MSEVRIATGRVPPRHSPPLTSDLSSPVPGFLSASGRTERESFSDFAGASGAWQGDGGRCGKFAGRRRISDDCAGLEASDR